MTIEQQVAWLCEHRALVNFGLTDVTIWCVPYAYVVEETLEEAIVAMQERMGVVESTIGNAHQPLLLAEETERI